MTSFEENQSIWEQRYSRGEVVLRYPDNHVVSFVMRQYGKVRNKSRIRILDLGCGGGNHTAFLAKEGFDYYAVDYSQSAIEWTCKTMEFHGITPDPKKIICSNISSLPFADGFFDAVIDRQTLDQNSSSELPGLVAEIYRVLKPGGMYFGINFSDQDPHTRFGKAFGNGDYTDFTAGYFKGIGKRHFFSLEEIKKLFSSFRIEDIQVAKLYSLFNPGEGTEEFVVKATKPGSSRGRARQIRDCNFTL